MSLGSWIRQFAGRSGAAPELAMRGLDNALHPSDPINTAPPVPPNPPLTADQQAKLDRFTRGATGTANFHGFIHDEGEYKHNLEGRYGAPIWEEMRRGDATVAAFEAALMFPILAADWTFDPGVKENEPGYALAKQLAKDVEDNFRGGLEYTAESGRKVSQTFESVLRNALLMLPFGAGAHERCYEVDNDKNKIRISRLLPLLPLTFYRFMTDRDGMTLQSLVQYGFRGASYIITEIPAEKLTMFVNDMEGGNWPGRSVFRPCYKPWYFKDGFYRIAGIQAERNAIGIPWIELHPNASPADVLQAWQWATNLTANQRTNIVTPNGCKFSLVSPTGRPLDLTPYIQHMDEQIVDRGLAGFLSLAKSATGSRAVGDVKVDFFMLSENHVAKQIGETISESDLRAYVDLNYDLKADQQNLYPKLRCGNITVVNALDLVAAWKDAGNSNVDILQPDDETENFVRRKMGMPLKSDTGGRVKYAPIVERIQEIEQGEEPIPTESANGEPEKQGKSQKSKVKSQNTTSESQAPNPAPQGDTQPGDKSHVLPSGRTVVPAKERERERLEAQAKLTSSAEPLIPRRELLPHERKHDFNAHIERQDRTARVVARILRSAKEPMVKAVAHQAAITPVAQMHTVSVGADPRLGRRVEQSLEVARRFGHAQVYAERKKATGRGKSAAIQNLKFKIQDSGVTLAAKPPKHAVKFNVEATISDFVNEISKRVKARAIDLAKQGVEGDELENQAAGDVLKAPDGFLDVIGQEASRAAVAGGRADAMRELDPEIEKYVRSEVMDKGTAECAEAGGDCEEGDGQEWDNFDDAPQPPFEGCAGDCRGQLIPVFEDEGAVILE